MNSRVVSIWLPAATLWVLVFSATASLFFLESAAAQEVVSCPPICDSCCPQEEEKEKGLWDLSAALGFNLTRGNSDTSLLNVNLKADTEQNKNIWRFEIDGNKGETEDETTQESLKGDAEYKRLLSERTYLGFGVSSLYDDIADVDYRVLLNPALGYFLLKDETFQLNFEAGPSMVFEKVGGDKDEYLSVRAAQRFEWTISETAKFFEAAEVIVSTEDADQSLVNAEVGIEAAINSHLALVFKLNNRYDNQPAEDTDRNDMSIVSGLQVNF